MRHSQEVHDAMQKVFDELLALTPQELREQLKKRKTGPLGYLMRETGTIDFLYNHHVYKDKSYYMSEIDTFQTVRTVRSWQSIQESDDYIPIDAIWLEAA